MWPFLSRVSPVTQCVLTWCPQLRRKTDRRLQGTSFDFLSFMVPGKDTTFLSRSCEGVMTTCERVRESAESAGGRRQGHRESRSQGQVPTAGRPARALPALKADVFSYKIILCAGLSMPKSESRTEPAGCRKACAGLGRHSASSGRLAKARAGSPSRLSDFPVCSGRTLGLRWRHRGPPSCREEGEEAALESPLPGEQGGILLPGTPNL